MVYGYYTYLERRGAPGWKSHATGSHSLSMRVSRARFMLGEQKMRMTLSLATSRMCHQR